MFMVYYAHQASGVTSKTQARTGSLSCVLAMKPLSRLDTVWIDRIVTCDNMSLLRKRSAKGGPKRMYHHKDKRRREKRTQVIS